MPSIFEFSLFYSGKLLSFVFSLYLAWWCYHKYQYWKYKPLLAFSISVFIFGIGNICSFIGQTRSSEAYDLSLLLLILADVAYYMSVYGMIWGIFYSRTIHSWSRLVIYAVIYGMGLSLVFSKSYFNIVFKNGIWVRNPHGTVLIVIEWLSDIPFIDLFFLLFMKTRSQSLNQRTKDKFKFIYIMIIIFLSFSLYRFFFFSSSSNLIVMSIDQLLMLTSFIIIFGIFLRKPLIFALSPSELLELHILRKNEEKIPVFSHSFSANNRNSANLKKNDKQNRSSIDNQENGGNTHQILPYIIISVMDLLKEATESEQRDENIKQIKYGDTFINIEYSEHYIALLLTKNLDFLYNFALRKMLKDVEQKYSENISDDGTSGSEEVGKTLFYALLEENFSFSFQKDGQDIDRETNQGEAF